MNHRARTLFATALLLALPVTSQAALSSYTQSFEGLVLASPTALGGDGWVVFGNVFSPTNVYLYGYGTFPAPNNSGGFSALAAGQGGPEQGAQQLSVYSDYNNLDHGVGNIIESNFFKEQTIGAADVGNVWTFQFDAKMGNLVAPSTALAFIKTLDPAAGYATTNFINFDMSAIAATWNTYSLSITITPGLVGQILQTGFSNKASLYVASGVFYDNLVWRKTAGVGVGPAGPSALELRPAAPNPFRNTTRLDYSLAQRGVADIGVFDVAGRRVATLFSGVAEAGPHVAIWDGRFADGRLAPAGVYHGVLQTAAGRVTRNIVLAR